MEYHNDILAIEANVLWEQEIVSFDYYRQMCVRNQIRIVRRGCKGTPALVAYESIPERFRRLIAEKMGDPAKRVAKDVLADAIVEDAEARKHYREFELEDGRKLPVGTIDEYTTNASILNALHTVANNMTAKRRAMGGNKTGIWEKLTEAVNRLDKRRYPHTLPTNERRLRDKLAKYLGDGYDALIDPRWGNSSAEKISDGAKIWLLAQWANKVSPIASLTHLHGKYNEEAEVRGWMRVKSEQSIKNFLYREDIKELWWGHRYGELKAKEKFALQNKTLMPTMRDSLWYSDGTKLNYYYLSENGKVETCTVYEVMDVYSEVLLGYHISKSEDYEAQFYAYKMALQNSGQKPYEVRYDNQGGHKKLESGNFLTKIARLCINTQPYNGKSKTIELAFGRFQSEYLKRDWFFTGQNVTAKKNESKANMEFILANVKNLPTLAEIKAKYKLRRDEWNNAKHPKTGRPRTEMYRESQNPRAIKIDMMDMVEIFWIERKDTVTCNAYGISFTEKKIKYDYLVYTADGRPDVKWLRKNIDKSFVIRFDPADMDLIYLYEQSASGLRFVKEARTKVATYRNIQEQEDWEKSYMKQLEVANKTARVETRDKMDAILSEFDLLPEQNGLNSPTLKGIESRRKKGEKSLGKAMKSVSYQDDDDNFNSIYDKM